MMGFEQSALGGRAWVKTNRSMKMSAGDQDLSRMQVKCCKSLVKKEGTEQKKQTGQGSK